MTAASFSWTSSGGAFGTPTTSTGPGANQTTSEVVWTMPAGCLHTVTVSITDAASNQTTHTFNVTNTACAGSSTWATSATSASSTFPNAVAVDNNNNVYIAGLFTGAASVGSTNLTALGAADNAFVAKLDGSGNWLWAKAITGSAGSAFAAAVAVDSIGNIYISGYFENIASFGSTSRHSNGAFDVFVAKLDSSGNWLGVKSAGASNIDLVYGVAVYGSGSAHVTGQFINTANFDSTSLNAGTSRDAFVWKTQIP